jgi:hypothetical protein
MLTLKDDAGPERSNDLLSSYLGFSNSKDFSAMNHIWKNLSWTAQKLTAILKKQQRQKH